MEDWYKRWAERHARVFGLRTEADMIMLASWRDVFIFAGYTESELCEATTWLAANAPPEYPNQHLSAVRDRVLSCRARTAATLALAAERDAPDRGTCALCGGTGFVSVPHPDCIVGGEWFPHPRSGARFVTGAVSCSCALGKWLQEQLRDTERRSLSLEVYHQKNPNWRKQMVRYDQTRHAEGKTEPPSSDWQSLVAALVRKFSREPGDDHPDD